MSTVRLIANTKRFGVSSGSHGSDAPVSPDAQPPSNVAANPAATAERRTPAVNAFDKLAIIKRRPRVRHIPALGTRGRNARSGLAPCRYPRSVSHTAPLL